MKENKRDGRDLDYVKMELLIKVFFYLDTNILLIYLVTCPLPSLLVIQFYFLNY